MSLFSVDDQDVSADDFITFMKLDGRYTDIADVLLKRKLTVAAAARGGRVGVDDTELQQRVDDFRRAMGLHRAQEMYEYLDYQGVTLEHFEQYMHEGLVCGKMYDEVANPQAVEEYFKLHSPRFEQIDLSHITLGAEGQAREILSLLEDDPDSFAGLAAEHSLADTRSQGGELGSLARDQVAPQVEAKLFNAQAGDVVGIFKSEDGLIHEIFKVNSKTAPTLDATTRARIRVILLDEWLAALAGEHKLSAG